MSDVARPVLRWHGGKWRLAPWIITHFPRHRVYVEPYGGAASVLLHKERAYAEIYNDRDGSVVTLFRVLRDPAKAARLIALLQLTPFARQEFDSANADAGADDVEAARALIVRSFMGFGSNAHAPSPHARGGCRATGFRANSHRSYTTPAHDWASYPGCLVTIVERLSGLCIEHRDGIAVMRAHDRADTLHYVDPPYLPETRGSSAKYDQRYRHDLSRSDHIRLLAALKKLKGFVVVSGYPSALYDRRLKGWARHETAAMADGARPRTEILWLNPAAAAALERERAGAGTPLFPHLELPDGNVLQLGIGGS